MKKGPGDSLPFEKIVHPFLGGILSFSGGVRDWFSRCNLSILILSDLIFPASNAEVSTSRPAKRNLANRLTESSVFPRSPNGPCGVFWSKKTLENFENLRYTLKRNPSKLCQMFTRFIYFKDRTECQFRRKANDREMLATTCPATKITTTMALKRIGCLSK